MAMNDIGNNSNGATASDVQVQFVGNTAGIYHENLLISWAIGMRQEEVPMLVPHKELVIVANNQPSMTNSTGVIDATGAQDAYKVGTYRGYDSIHHDECEQDSLDN